MVFSEFKIRATKEWPEQSILPLVRDRSIPRMHRHRIRRLVHPQPRLHPFLSLQEPYTLHLISNIDQSESVKREKERADIFSISWSEQGRQSFPFFLCRHFRGAENSRCHCREEEDLSCSCIDLASALRLSAYTPIPSAIFSCLLQRLCFTTSTKLR